MDNFVLPECVEKRLLISKSKVLSRADGGRNRA